MRRLLLAGLIALCAAAGCAHEPAATRAERLGRAEYLLGRTVTMQPRTLEVVPARPELQSAPLRAQVEWTACYQYVDALTTPMPTEPGRSGARFATEVPDRVEPFAIVHADLDDDGRCEAGEPLWRVRLSATSEHQRIVLGDALADASECRFFDRPRR